jgi:hypothetical protein
MRFSYNARGSLTETENHLIAAKDLGYLPLGLYQQARSMGCELQRLINGYIDYLKRHKPGKDEPGHNIIVPEPRIRDQEPYPDS